MALLAHQLMTPLATISSLSQGLMRRADQLSTADVRNRAEKIWRACLQLHELIETILSYTRVNAGAIALNPSPFNIKALIRRICREQNKHEPERIFELDIERLPSLFVGDAILLEQVVVIVLSNAMKYSTKEQPIRVEGREEDGRIIIVVRDRGMGISEDDIPYLMQPFFRGQNAMQMPGTGLGLSLAWHILKLHGGSLKIESRKKHGATVTIALPIDRSQFEE